VPAETQDERDFLAAIEAAPEDTAPHKVFADWLDEHDRPEEAVFHRRWTVEVAKAEAWLRDLAQRYHLFDPFPKCIREIVDGGYCHGSGGDSLREDLHDDEDLRADLFENWQTFSGERVPFRKVVNRYFSCGC
jgi:uncharacterized protein (TIGR02996 family)